MLQQMGYPSNNYINTYQSIPSGTNCHGQQNTTNGWQNGTQPHNHTAGQLPMAMEEEPQGALQTPPGSSSLFNSTTAMLPVADRSLAVPGGTTGMVIPETVESPLYVPGFLSTQLGKLMRVEFLIGNNMNDRVGVLVAVGASYILLQPAGEVSTIMCDLFSIKFVTIINPDLEDVVVFS